MLAIYILSRWLFIFEANSSPQLGLIPGLDEDLHWSAAGYILAGASQNQPVFELMLPSSLTFTYLIALIRLISFDSILVAKILFSMIGLTNCCLLYGIAKKMNFKGGLQWLPTLIYILTPTMAYFDVMLMKSSIQLLAIFSVIYLLLNIREKNKITGMSIAAIYFLLIMLCSIELAAIFTIAGAVFGLWIYAPLKRRQKTLVTMLLITAPLVSSGVQLGFVSGSPYPWFLPQSGIHLAIGQNSENRGFYTRIPEIAAWPYGHLFNGRVFADLQRGKPTSFSEANSFFRHLAIQNITAHPGQWLKLSMMKTLHFFNNYEAKGVDLLDFQRGYTFTLGVMPFCFGFCFIFAVAYCTTIKDKDALLETIFLALFILGPFVAVQGSFISFRYRVDVWAPLIILGSLGIKYAGNIRLLHVENRKFALMMLAATITTFYPLTYADRLDQIYQSNFNIKRKAQIAESLSEDRANTGSVCKFSALQFDVAFQFTNAFNCINDREKTEELTPTEEMLRIKYLLWLGNYDDIKTLWKRVGSSALLSSSILSRNEFELLRTRVIPPLP